MKKSWNEICIEVKNKMVSDGVPKHVQFISTEEKISFGLKEGGRIPKNTIEWVNAPGADESAFVSQNGAQKESQN